MDIENIINESKEVGKDTLKKLAEPTKGVQSDFITVVGNLISINDMIIPISSISMVRAESLQQAKFPVTSIVLILVGFLCINVRFVSFFRWIGIILFLIAAIVILLWVVKNKKREKVKTLTFEAHSGKITQLYFFNHQFLQEVLSTFKVILSQPSSHSNYVFDIKNQTTNVNSNNTTNSHNSNSGNAYDNKGAVFGNSATIGNEFHGATNIGNNGCNINDNAFSEQMLNELKDMKQELSKDGTFYHAIEALENAIESKNESNIKEVIKKWKDDFVKPFFVGIASSSLIAFIQSFM